MAVETLVSVEEYLGTSYDPDLEYVDGRLVERNVGEPDHGRLQLLIADALRAFEKLRDVRVFVETRLLVAETEGKGRYRIPDVCMMRTPLRRGKALLDPPLVAVEVLSPDDTLEDLLDRTRDYLQCGVRHVWIADPKGRVFTVHPQGLTLVEESRIEIPELSLAVRFDELFRELADQ